MGSDESDEENDGEDNGGDDDVAGPRTGQLAITDSGSAATAILIH